MVEGAEDLTGLKLGTEATDLCEAQGNSKH